MTSTNDAAESSGQTMNTPRSKKAWTITAAVVVVLAILAFLAYRYKSLVIAATVNGHPISRISVIKQREQTDGKNALTTIINNRLIDDAAKAKGINVSESDVDKDVSDLQGQFSAQGQNLADALSQQHMTMDDLRTQFRINDELKKLLADKIQVSDDEVAKYITDNKVNIPSGQEAAYKAQLKSQMQQQKLDNAAQDFVNSLRSAAKINTFVNY